MTKRRPRADRSPQAPDPEVVASSSEEPEIAKALAKSSPTKSTPTESTTVESPPAERESPATKKPEVVGASGPESSAPDPKKASSTEKKAPKTSVRKKAAKKRPTRKGAHKKASPSASTHKQPAESSAKIEELPPAEIAETRPCRARPGQYLTFFLGDDEYAVPILETREIVELGACTPVPATPVWMLGVMNLRGSVIPVVDLAAKLGQAKRQLTRAGNVIIVEVRQSEDDAIIGMLVDHVHEVCDLAASELEPVPTFGTPIRVDCLLGLGQRGEDLLLLLLDVKRLLSLDELLSATTAATDPMEAQAEAAASEGQAPAAPPS